MDPLETPEGLRARVAEDFIVAQMIMDRNNEYTTTVCYHLEQGVLR